MPRRRGDGEKAQEFERLLAEGVEPLEAAKLAGYARPDKVVAKRERWAREDAAKPKPDESDADLARRTLRNVARLATADAPRVAAARELLASTPDTRAGDQCLVVFRGREGKGQYVSADIEPEVLAAAIEHVQAQRTAAEERELAEFAAERGLDVEEFELAWALFNDPDAKSAALRVFLGKQGRPGEA